MIKYSKRILYGKSADIINGEIMHYLAYISIVEGVENDD